MIPAAVPHDALYESEYPDGGPKYRHSKPVVAWDEDGHALVADEKWLVRANRWSNFVGIEETNHPIVAALPGGGHRAEFKSKEGETYSYPVIAWLIRSDGWIYPVDCDGDGMPYDPTESSNFERIYHPDEEETDK